VKQRSEYEKLADQIAERVAKGLDTMTKQDFFLKALCEDHRRMTLFDLPNSTSQENFYEMVIKRTKGSTFKSSVHFYFGNNYLEHFRKHRQLLLTAIKAKNINGVQLVTEVIKGYNYDEQIEEPLGLYFLSLSRRH
jgi:hypothetical protein